MAIEESTARTRELGGELKRVREQAKLSGHGLARLLGWPAPKISRLETGKRGVSEVEVAMFLARCRVTPDEMDRLMRLARLTDDGYRLQDNGDKLPEELLSLIKLETTTEALLDYEPALIPGLLQTESYVREFLRWGKHPTGPAFESRVNARLARQAIFSRQWPPRLTFCVHEHALRSMVGGPRLMHEQILHLVLTNSLPRCQVRVIPADAAPFGMFGGSFRFMRFADDPPVVYAQTHTASLFLDGEKEIGRYRDLVNDLELAALGSGESREWLAALASEYDRAETGEDVSREPPRISLA
jgi:transcriptional regulator with XRE-family HTH domain